MAERNHRAVRMGIDVGGTYTKCVAMDNESHEIIGKNQVKTTHDDKSGVAAGVVKSFQNCMRENNIAPEDVVFVAHSTTQATNALKATWQGSAWSALQAAAWKDFWQSASWPLKTLFWMKRLAG